MLKSLLILPVCLLVSCASSKPPSAEYLELKRDVELNKQRFTQKIQILSDPVGARIEINQEYIGETPCVVEVVTNGHGEFVEKFDVNALPTHAGHSVQFKWFRSYDKAPARIFFDMSLRRTNPSIDVNIFD